MITVHLEEISFYFSKIIHKYLFFFFYEWLLIYKIKNQKFRILTSPNLRRHYKNQFTVHDSLLARTALDKVCYF